MTDNQMTDNPTSIDPNVCAVCGMRSIKVGDVEEYETDWNRKGYGKHLTRSEAIDRVCQYASSGCIALASFNSPLIN